MDAGVAELMKQGLGYLLFVLSIGVIVWLQKRYDHLQERYVEDRKSSDKDLAAVNDKRLDETKQVVLAMERSTMAASDQTTAVRGLATAVGDLTKGFAALVVTQENFRVRFSEIGERLEKRQEEMLTMLRQNRG